MVREFHTFVDDRSDSVECTPDVTVQRTVSPTATTVLVGEIEKSEMETLYSAAKASIESNTSIMPVVISLWADFLSMFSSSHMRNTALGRETEFRRPAIHGSISILRAFASLLGAREESWVK
jgi:hypothetical protein